MIQGVWKLLGGMGLLLVKAELRAVLWRIVMLLTALLIALIVGAMFFADWLIMMWVPQGDTWYWQVLAWLAWVLAVLFAMITSVLGFSVLGSAATAPWLDMLAARTESLYGQTSQASGKSFVVQMMQSLGNSIRPLLGLSVWGMLALGCFIIPLIGPLLATILWAYGGMRFLIYELMDTTASRRDWSFIQRKEDMKQRGFFWLGFGGSAMLLMFVPFVNLLVLPAAVVALSKSFAEDEGEKKGEE